MHAAESHEPSPSRPVTVSTSTPSRSRSSQVPMPYSTPVSGPVSVASAITPADDDGHARHDQRPRAKRHSERQREERQRSHEEARPRPLPTEGEVVRRVVGEKRKRDGSADERLGSAPRAPEERQAGKRGEDERRHDEETLLRHEERERSPRIREPDAVEPFVVRPHDRRRAVADRRFERVRVAQAERPTQGPCVVGEQRRDAERRTCEIRADAPHGRGSEGGVAGQHGRDESEWELRDDGEAREQAGHGRRPPRSRVAARREQDDERGEAEHRGEHVIEEERREGQKQRSDAEQEGRRQPVARHDALHCHEDEQEQGEEGKHRAEEVHLPEPVAIRGLASRGRRPGTRPLAGPRTREAS